MPVVREMGEEEEQDERCVGGRMRMGMSGVYEEKGGGGELQSIS